MVGSEGAIRNFTDENQKVWLIVNDTALDGSDYSREAYLLGEDVCTLTKRYRDSFGYEGECDHRSLTDAKDRWDNINQDSYWNIWYDDNIGSYLVKFNLGDKAHYPVLACSYSRADYIRDQEKRNAQKEDPPNKVVGTTDDMNEIYELANYFKFVPKSTKEKRPVLYSNHVFMTAGQHKGKILMELISRSASHTPAAVIFVDDKQENIDNVVDSLYAAGIDIQAFRYTREDHNVQSFEGTKTIDDWCKMEEALMEIQEIMGKDNFMLPESQRTPVCSKVR